MNGVNKAATKFEKDIDKWLRGKAKLQSEEEKLAIMMDTTHGLRYPPGVRPFRSQAEHSELDDVLGDCMNSDFMVSIVLPKGS